MSGPYWQQAWNPVRGCTPISPGCTHCWARAMHERFRDEPFTDVRCLPEALSKPLHWKKPRVVFIDCADIFHGEVPAKFIAAVFAVMAACQQHTFLLCTKRAQRAHDLLTEWNRFGGAPQPGPINHFLTAAIRASGGAKWADDMRDRIGFMVRRNGDPVPWRHWPLPNVWLGVTAEDQQRADDRIPLLLATPAAHRWVSVEPMLGPVDLDRWLWDGGESVEGIPCQPASPTYALDQVIIGCESGPKRRPCRAEWITSIAEQCTAASVPCFVKQDSLGGKVITDGDAIRTLYPSRLRVRDLAWMPSPARREGE